VTARVLGEVYDAVLCGQGHYVMRSLPASPGVLPRVRGPLTEQLWGALQTEPHDIGTAPSVADADEDDFHLALYACYELHYRGLPGVADGWEWEPSLLGLRRELEDRFEAQLCRQVGPVDTDATTVVDDLWRLAGPGEGPSLSAWLLEHGTMAQARELAKHRSAYQLKEADPHSWAIPRLEHEAKAVMVAIQADEYGDGVSSAMHSSLFADTMRALGLDSNYHAYLDELPGLTLATTNLISFFGLHRRWRGALIGHLALFEMTSVGPMGRYAAWMDRLGVDPSGRRFYDVHVTADEHHQHLAADGMVAGLVRREPDLAADVIFGAAALGAVEGRFSRHLFDCWSRGRSSLRPATVGLAAA
jgi:hypothetical protein